MAIEQTLSDFQPWLTLAGSTIEIAACSLALAARGLHPLARSGFFGMVLAGLAGWFLQVQWMANGLAFPDGLGYLWGALHFWSALSIVSLAAGAILRGAPEPA